MNQKLKDLKVSEIMSKDVITVQEYEPLCNFENYFHARKIHHIIVEDDNNNLSGIISLSDVINIRAWIHDSKITAKQIMTPNPQTINTDAKTEKAIRTFLQNTFRALPVLDSKKELVGIVTPYDILKTISDS